MQEKAVDLRHSDYIFAPQPQGPVSSPASSLGETEDGWPLLEVRDYVNAFVMNEAGEAMVLERFSNGGAWGSWQMIGRYIGDGEDPLTAVQNALLTHTGYAAEQWIYLGTFVIDDAAHLGAGHFFCARGSHRVAECPTCPDIRASEQKIKWVSPKHIKRALLDGRIAVINYAIAATLALTMCDAGF